MRERGYVVVVTSGLLWGLVCAPSTAQVSLVRDGTARAVVVRGEEATETAMYAVEELVRHVALATGVELEVVSESDAPISAAPEDVHTRVYVGDMETARAHGIDVDRLPREAYAIRPVGNDLFIVGREDDGDPLRESNPNVGTLFGVYEFLERYVGVRWLWPGRSGTYVPHTDTLELWPVNEIGAPSLAFRSFAFYGIGAMANEAATIPEEDARLGFSTEVAHAYYDAVQVLLRRHRMGGTDVKPPTTHAFSGWWKRYGKEHPEWFALRRDGTRGDPNPENEHVPMCVTNEELQDFIVEQWDGESVLRLGPVDRPGRCICDNCRAWDGPQPDPPPWFAERMYKGDHRSADLFPGSTSDRYARFWKVIQEKASERNPHAVVSGSFIYENEFAAPVTGVKLNKNIYAEFVQWQDPHLRWFPMPDEAFEWIKEQWAGWRATGLRMGYRPNYLHDGYVMPHFETRQSGEFFKFAYERGMEGARFDSLTGQWATQGLRLYMHMRLMSKPELELEAIRDEYFSAFGPAADTMERYFDYWEDYAFENRMRFIELYSDVGWRYRVYAKRAHEAFPPESFDPATELIEHATRETSRIPDGQYLTRVKFVELGLEHAKLATKLTAIYDGRDTPPEDRVEEAKEALKALVAFRKRHQDTFFSDLLHVTSFWERPRMNLDALATEMSFE